MQAVKNDTYEKIIGEIRSYVHYLKNSNFKVKKGDAIQDYINYADEVLGKVSFVGEINSSSAVQIYYAVTSLKRYHEEFGWSEDRMFFEKCREYLFRINIDAKRLLDEKY